MINKTQGIVLSYVKYKDTSIIVRVFTREMGLRSYIVNSVRKKNKGNKLIYFQPISLLDLVVYENPEKDINRISEVTFNYSSINTLTDVKRSSVIIFLCEFLEKLILTEEENTSLYDFISNSIIGFDQKFTPNFHIDFLLSLSSYVGIDIDPEFHLSLYSEYIVNKQLRTTGITSEIRQKITGELLDFYKMHLDKNVKFKSLPVLIAVLHN